MVTICHCALGIFENELPDIKPNKDGFYQIDDMVLNERQFNETFYSSEEVMSRGGAQGLKWPNGIIPYKFDNAASFLQKQKVANAISYFNSQFEGCLKIRLLFLKKRWSQID